jgi:anti-sigma factor RsiW
MSHVDEGLLHSYVDGAVPPGERERLAAHFSACPDCRARLQEARALASRASELLAHATPPGGELPDYARVRHRARRPRPWRVPVTWAASVAAAFAIGWYAQAQRGTHHALDSVTDATRISSRAPGSPANTAPVSPPARTPAAQAAPSRAAGARAPRAVPVQPPVAEGAARVAPLAESMAAAAPERRDRAPALLLDTASARSLLGREPAVLADRPVLTVTHMPGQGENAAVIVIEQELDAGTVIRLYERQVPAGAGEAVPAAPAPGAASERLARYVGTLRIEIAGPLSTDSLSRLLDLVR